MRRTHLIKVGDTVVVKNDLIIYPKYHGWVRRYAPREYKRWLAHGCGKYVKNGQKGIVIAEGLHEYDWIEMFLIEIENNLHVVEKNTIARCKRMTPITIFEELANVSEQEDSKRLYINRLTTLQHRILKKLKYEHVGKGNAISMADLAKWANIVSGDSKRMIRKHINKLREEQDVKISSCNNGYYIPLLSEEKESDRMMISQTLTRMDTVINMSNKNIMILYKHLNERAKTLDLATQNQMKMQFNGWENDSVNYFGDKYKKEEK